MDQEKYENLCNLKQGLDEKSSIFIDKVLKDLHTLNMPLTDQEILRLVFRGLKPEVSYFIKQRAPHTVSELRHFAEEAEGVLQHLTPKKLVNSSRPDYWSTRPPRGYKCFSCQALGDRYKHHCPRLQSGNETEVRGMPQPRPRSPPGLRQ